MRLATTAPAGSGITEKDNFRIVVTYNYIVASKGKEKMAKGR